MLWIEVVLWVALLLPHIGFACHCDPTHIQNGICTTPNTVAIKGHVRWRMRVPEGWESEYLVDIVEIFHDPRSFLDRGVMNLYIPDEVNMCVLELEVGQSYYIEASYWGRFQTDSCTSSQPWPDDPHQSEELRDMLHHVDCTCQVKICEDTIWPGDYPVCLAGILYDSQCLMDLPNSIDDCDVTHDACARDNNVCSWRRPLPDNCTHQRGEGNYYDYQYYFET